MKTSNSIFTKIALGLLVAGSLAACTPKPATSTTSTTTPAADKEPIVYVNSDTLISKYDYAKDMSKRLDAKGNAAQADVASRQQAFQREVADYQKEQATLPADQRQQKEQRLQRENQEFQTYQQNASAQFQTDKTTEITKMYDRIYDFAKKYAKEKGYKTVLTYSKTNPGVLFVDPALDVTADVVKKLNDDYTKDKK